MKKLIPVLICLLSVNILLASDPEWHPGSIVLRSNDVLRGQIAIHESHDMVLFQSGDGMMVLPAHKVRTILFYDAASDINRKFVTVGRTENFRPQYRIFEVVISGDIMVLRRKPTLFTSKSDDAAYDYFIFKGDEIWGIRKFRSRVYPYILENSPEVAQFVKTKRLCPSFPADIIQIITHHNQATTANRVMADHR